MHTLFRPMLYSCSYRVNGHTIPYHVRLLHKFDKLQTYIKEMTKLDNIKYCDNDIVQDDKND